MKKHIRHKRAKPRNTVCIHYIDPETDKVYTLERMSVSDYNILYNALKGIAKLDKTKIISENELFEYGYSMTARWLEEYGDEYFTKTNRE